MHHAIRCLQCGNAPGCCVCIWGYMRSKYNSGCPLCRAGDPCGDNPLGTGQQRIVTVPRDRRSFGWVCRRGRGGRREEEEEECWVACWCVALAAAPGEVNPPKKKEEKKKIEHGEEEEGEVPPRKTMSQRDRGGEDRREKSPPPLKPKRLKTKKKFKNQRKNKKKTVLFRTTPVFRKDRFLLQVNKIITPVHSIYKTFYSIHRESERLNLLINTRVVHVISRGKMRQG